MTENAYAVEMKDIVVRFPGVLANDRVNFQLKRGEIHALLGENGAGKSTRPLQTDRRNGQGVW
jgi:ABC-type uncharacterized transport system ATPase subunit